MLLDDASFFVLFDNKVQKLNVLEDTFMRSTKFTVFEYFNRTKPNHKLIKDFFLQALTRWKDAFLPLFRIFLHESITKIEEHFKKNKK